MAKKKVARKPVFVLIAELMLARGITNIKDLPFACELWVDDKWTLYINGHEKNVIANNCDIPPHYAYIEYGEMPAGLINPFFGAMIGSVVANEDALCDALEKARQVTLAGVTHG